MITFRLIFSTLLVPFYFVKMKFIEVTTDIIIKYHKDLIWIYVLHCYILGRLLFKKPSWLVTITAVVVQFLIRKVLTGTVFLTFSLILKRTYQLKHTTSIIFLIYILKKCYFALLFMINLKRYCIGKKDIYFL